MEGMMRSVLRVCQGQYTFVMSHILPLVRVEVNGVIACEPPPLSYVWDALEQFLYRVVLSVFVLRQDVGESVIHLH